MGQVDYKFPFGKRSSTLRVPESLVANLIDEMKAYVGGNKTDV